MQELLAYSHDVVYQLDVSRPHLAGILSRKQVSRVCAGDVIVRNQIEGHDTRDSAFYIQVYSQSTYHYAMIY